MNNALLRNLTFEELLHEMSLSTDVLTKALVPKLDDLADLHEEIVKHDIELPLVVKDYQNFNMKLNDFLETEYWQNWDESNRNNLPFHHDGHDRARRIDEAAEYGCDGSTHGEVIEDWIACLDDRDADLEFGPLTVQRLMIEAENTHKYFTEQGTINDQIY